MFRPGTQDGGSGTPQRRGLCRRVSWVSGTSRARGTLACLWGWLVVLLGGLAPSISRGAVFNASLENTSIPAGESTILSLEFQELQVPNPPAIPGVTNATIQYIGPSQQLLFKNGQQSFTITHRYQVTPRAAGEVHIPSLSVRAGNQVLTSPALRLSVTPPESAVTEENRLAFVRLSTPTNEVVLGESFPIEVKLYFTAVENAEPPRLNIDGFTLGKVGSPEQSRARMGETTFGVVTWRMAITAAKAGDLPFGPAELNAILRLPQQRRRGLGAFDIFGDMVAERRKVALSSPTNSIRVVPPPVAGRPPEFDGAVGQFRLLASIAPTNVAVGDPVTLKVQVAGHGNLEQLSAPKFSGADSFKLYDPRADLQTTDPLGLEGVKSFEQIVIPERADLPLSLEVRFAYFDPETRNYRTLVHPLPRITVRGNTAQQAAPSRTASDAVATSPEPAQPTQDRLRHIQAMLGPRVAHPPWWILRPWFLAALAFPLPACAAYALVVNRRRRLLTDPRRQQRLRSREAAATALAQLDRTAAAGDGAAFFEHLGTALRERIGLVLGAPAAGITEEVVQERLRPLGIPGDDLERLDSLFAALNQARFAPSHSTRELNELRSQAATLCRTLEEWEGRG